MGPLCLHSVLGAIALWCYVVQSLNGIDILDALMLLRFCCPDPLSQLQLQQDLTPL